jgi:hypothetical protein
MYFPEGDPFAEFFPDLSDDGSSWLFSGGAGPLFDLWADFVPECATSHVFDPPPAVPAPPIRLPESPQRPARPPAPRRNKVRKGQGAHSKQMMPDPFDHYAFKTKSIAYVRLVGLGYPNISLIKVLAVCEVIQSIMQADGIRLTERNRPAKRRSPCAFHWLDENWTTYGPQVFDRAVFTALGMPYGPRLV